MSLKRTPRPTVLRINGLKGRMLQLPAVKTRQRQILLVYAGRSSIEAVQGLAKLLNSFGTVTAPDLPGMGGMTSFYTIGAQPSIDNYASYLAAFIELCYHRKRNITVVCVGESTLFVTRMLQNHRKAADKVTSVISIGGILHQNDMPQLRANRLLQQCAYQLLLLRPFVWLASQLRFGWLIKGTHAFKDQPADIRELDARLWQRNDLRTYLALRRQLQRVDVCAQPVDKPLRLVWADFPRGVDMQAVKQHGLIVYKRVTTFIPKHTLRYWPDLYSETYVTKALRTKFRQWLG